MNCNKDVFGENLESLTPRLLQYKQAQLRRRLKRLDKLRAKNVVFKGKQQGTSLCNNERRMCERYTPMIPFSLTLSLTSAQTTHGSKLILADVTNRTSDLHNNFKSIRKLDFY